MKEHKDQLDWRVISSNPTLTEEFLIEMKDYVTWEYVLKHNENINDLLKEDLENGRNFNSKFYEYISFNPNINKEIISMCRERLNWDFIIFKNSYVKNEMKIEEYEQYVNWNSIHNDAKQFNQFDITFIKKYKKYLNWRWVTEILVKDGFEFSIAFMDEMKGYIDWTVLLLNKRFSVEILKRYQDKLNWDIVSGGQTLSEEFMEQFSKHLNWYLISKYQKLSFSFIKKHIHKIHIENLKMNISTDFTTKEWEELKKQKNKKVLQSIWFDFINKEKYKNY